MKTVKALLSLIMITAISGCQLYIGQLDDDSVDCDGENTGKGFCKFVCQPQSFSQGGDCKIIQKVNFIKMESENIVNSAQVPSYCVCDISLKLEENRTINSVSFDIWMDYSFYGASNESDNFEIGLMDQGMLEPSDAFAIAISTISNVKHESIEYFGSLNNNTSALPLPNAIQFMRFRNRTLNSGDMEHLNQTSALENFRIIVSYTSGPSLTLSSDD